MRARNVGESGLLCQVVPDRMRVPTAATGDALLAAVQAVCQRFFAEGCQTAMHSCVAERAYCDAGACDLTLP
jgi:hypothetical protein